MKLYKLIFKGINKPSLLIAIVSFSCSFFLLSCSRSPDHKPVSVIFDTDIGPDYDDVGAITILHAMAQKGEAKILATVADNKYKGIAAVLDVFNTYWGEPGIPVGVPKGQAVDMRDSQHWTDSILAKYPHTIKSNEDVPGSVKVYRKVLAAQPDTSVTIISVGFLTNLADLLQSGPDQYSSLDGVQLVKKKVKLLVCMGGAFPSSKEYSRYGNFNTGHDSTAARYALGNWPTKIIFSGFEVGEKILTGLPLVHNDTIHNDPAKDVFRISIPQHPADSAGRKSWDETVALVAVRGYKPYFTLKRGKIIMHADGTNDWDNSGTGQYYLVQKASPQKVADVINQLMMETPKEGD